jgi:hypothetical protein
MTLVQMPRCGAVAQPEACAAHAATDACGSWCGRQSLQGAFRNTALLTRRGGYYTSKHCCHAFTCCRQCAPQVLGVRTWRGVREPGERPIAGATKRVWKWVPTTEDRAALAALAKEAAHARVRVASSSNAAAGSDT